MFPFATSPAEFETVLRVLALDDERGRDLRQLLVAEHSVAVLEGERAALVASAQGSWRVVEAAAGLAEPLRSILCRLRDASDAVHWVGDVVPLADEVLQQVGLRPIARESFLQDLVRVPRDEPNPEGITFAACEGKLVAPAKRLFGRVHAFTVEGVYCTRPGTPTAPSCQAAFQDYVEGSYGAPSPRATVVALQGTQVVGVVSCAGLPERDGVAVLLGLAVDPALRGKGVARGLVRRAQQGLLLDGYRHMEFWTNDRNLPVHRLFVPEEIVEHGSTRDWLGMRDRVTGEWLVSGSSA